MVQKARIFSLLLIHILILLHVYVWKSSTVLFAFAFTQIFGRFFCGWACHFGAIQELSYYILKKLNIKTITIDSKLVTLLPIIILLNYYVLPNVYHAMQNPWTSIEITLNEPDIWAFLPGMVIGSITFAVDGFMIVYFLGKKGFCRFLCPWGAFLKIPNALALFKVRKTDTCTHCHVCTTDCPVGIDVSYEINTYKKVVSTNCTSCMMCTSGCPSNALSYKFSNPLKENYTINQFLPKKDNFSHQNISYLFKNFRKFDYKILVLTIILSVSIDGLYGIGHFLAYGIGLITSYYIIVFTKTYTTNIKILIRTLIIFLFMWHGILKYSIWNGIRYYDDGNFNKSISHLERAVKMYPKKIGKFHSLLGIMYFELNDLAKASYYTKKAIQINPDYKSSKELLKLIQNNSN